MNKASDLRHLLEGGTTLDAVLNKLAYGISNELDGNPNNMSSGNKATTKFELANDQDDNWIEFQLWDKNRFDTPLGAIRYVCSMSDDPAGNIRLANGKGIVSIPFDSKLEDLDTLADLDDMEKENYRENVKKISGILSRMKFNIVGTLTDNSFEGYGKQLAADLIHKCSNYLK